MKHQLIPSISPLRWQSHRLAIPALLVLLAAPVQAQPYPAGSVVYPQTQGEEVAALQQRLVDLGYYQGPVTGYFDPDTQAAVTQFQQANGLDADGIVGSATQQALFSNSAPQTSAAAPQAPASGGSSYPSYLQLTDSGDQVLALQQQLAQQGYYTGTPSGVFDSQTQMSVMNFQRAHGLSVDGIVGSATEVALTGTATATQTAAAPDATAATYTPAATPDDGFMQLGDVGTEVSNLQTQLQALGYYNGPISGSFGSQTQAALIAFQQAQGLTADGIAGPQVSVALSGVPSTVQTTAAATPVQPTTPTFQQAQPAQPATPTFQQAQPAAPVIPSTPSAVVTVPPLTTQPALGQAPVAPVQTQSMMPPAQPLPPSNATPPQNSGRFTVLDLQRRLQLHGFDPADMSGVFDTTTQSAIMQAQQAYGLSQSDLFEGR